MPDNGEISATIFSKSNIVNISPLICVIPVSYTHLDVYKRQDITNHTKS